MKRVICLLIASLILCLLFIGCTSTKTVHCDKCGKEFTVSEDSPMNDDSWTIYCHDCEHELGLDEIVPER